MTTHGADRAPYDPRVRFGPIEDLEGETDAALAAIEELGGRGDVRIAFELRDLRFRMGVAPDADTAP